MKQRSYTELADIFDALERLAEGDPTVHLAEDGGDDPISQLRRAVNRTAAGFGELVDTAHEFAMALAEHFDVLNRVAQGELDCRVRGDSPEEILQCLKEVTNRTIQHLAEQIVSNRLAESRLQESELRYRTLFEKSGDAMLVMGRDRILDCNEAALRLFGYADKEEIQGLHPSELSPPEQPGGLSSDLQALQMVTRALEEGSLRYRWTHRRRGGEVFPAETLLTPIPVGNHRLIHVLVRDISEQIRTEEARQNLQRQLQQAQKLEAVGTLAGGIAHDFNNTLAPIIGYTEMALDELDKGSLIHRNLGHVLTCAERARDLVRQILAFSRDGECDIRPLPAAAVVAETLLLLRASLPSTVEIRSHIDRHGTSVLANPSHIHQVVLNLCTNAAFAVECKGGGMLSVDLAAVELDERAVRGELGLRAGTYVRLAVSDDGCGIPAAHLERIFEPFFTTKEVGQGTGMGLSMVHGIVRELGGVVRVESQVGEGSTFEVLLPQAPTVADPVEKKPLARAQDRGSGRILLVDDEQILVDFLTQALGRKGYVVTGMTSSEDALSAFEQDPEAFDVVVTDQTMPRMTGIVLAERMLGRCPDLPVVLCTGFSESVTPESAAAKGIYAYLSKPFSIDEISQLVQQAIGARVQKERAAP